MLEKYATTTLGCALKCLQLNGFTAWASLYLDGELAGFDDGSISTCASGFDDTYASHISEEKLKILQGFHYTLCSRRPVEFRTYLDWAEGVAVEILTVEASLGNGNSELVKGLLMILGNRLNQFRNHDETALKRLVACAQTMMRDMEVSSMILKPIRYNNQYQDATDPVFVAALHIVDWCDAQRVNLTQEQLERLRCQLRALPHRIGIFINDRHYNPLAKITTGEYFIEFLVRTSVEAHPGLTGSMVTWAEAALESCASINLRIDFSSLNIDLEMLGCLLLQKRAVSAMAIVLDGIGVLLTEKYLPLRINSSYIPRIKQLLVEHAQSWPDDPKAHKIVMSLAEQLWKEVLWHYSAERIDSTDHIQMLHFGSMRSCVLTLIQEFPNVPVFVDEFMRGHHGDLVQRNAHGVRRMIRDLVPDGQKKSGEDCCVM